MYQYLFDPEIHRMLINFYNICGIRVGIHAPDMTILTEFPPKSEQRYEMLRFCDKVRHHSETFSSRCQECDLAAYKHIRATKKAYIYRCHMGFMEALIPIVAEGEIICALMIGQVRSETEDYTPSRMASYLSSVGVPEEAQAGLLASYDAMISMAQTRFEALAYFLEICAQSIYDNRWIHRDEVSVTENFENYIRANLYNDISISDAADALNISTSHLSRILARDLGTTFTQYLNSCRISIAKELLRTTPMTVNEISVYLCYSDPNYFMRVFKRFTSMTCLEYRKSVTEGKT